MLVQVLSWEGGPKKKKESAEEALEFFGLLDWE